MDYVMRRRSTCRRRIRNVVVTVTVTVVACVLKMASFSYICRQQRNITEIGMTLGIPRISVKGKAKHSVVWIQNIRGAFKKIFEPELLTYKKLS